MRKFIRIVIITAVVFFVLCLSAIGDESKEARADESVSSVAEEGYLICIEGGYLHMYRTVEGENVLIKRETYMPIREYDKKMLLAGIKAETMQEALEIFENFIS